VSEDDALRYLKLWKFDDEQATKIYELVGGRMVHLKSMADEIKNQNNTFEGM